MRHRTLHSRFLRVVVGVSTVLLVIAGGFVFRAALAHYVHSEQSSVRAMVSAVEKSLAVGAYARDMVLLNELLEGLVHHPSVRRVEILDAEGNAQMSAAGPRQEAHTPTPSGPDLALGFVSPFDPSEGVGQLRLWLDNERLSDEARRQAALAVGAMVALVIAVLAVFNALARRLLSRPMHRLAEELSAIAPGTQDRLSINAQHAEDEVGVVTAAANRLLALQENALSREREMREAIAAMEARYRGIFDSSNAGIFGLSMQGILQHANPATWRLIDRNAADSTSFFELPFADPSQVSALVERSRASRQPESDDLELIHRDGGRAWLHCMLTVIEASSSTPPHIEGVLYDVTRRHQREQANRHRAEHDPLTGLKSRSYIESLLDTSVHSARARHDAVTLMFIDLDGFKGVNDRWGHAAGDAVLVESARRLRELFKRNSDTVGRLGGDELVVMVEGVTATDPEVADLAASVVRSLKLPFDLPNGEQATIGASVGLASYPLHATNAETLIHAADAAMYAVKKSGKGGFVVAVTGGDSVPVADGTRERHRSPDVALADPLTGLADRRLLVNRLDATGAEIAATGAYAAVICVDIDQFKTINLAYGPQIGDEVLCEVAQRLRRGLRQGDTLARTGSDEFVALIGTEAEAAAGAAARAQAVVDKLSGLLAAPVAAGTRQISLRASLGVSLLAPGTPHPQQVLQEAQLALRLAKSRRRGGALFFEPAMMEGFLERSELENDLQRAVTSHQLRLHIQPQVGRFGQVCGGEALVRWQHPQRGLVPPNDFIPLAESSGIIVDLGRWVLHRGCEILAAMNLQGTRRTLAINVSPLQFNHPEFVADVRAALVATGAPANALILEITEGLLIYDIAQVAAKLNELAGLGIRFSVDDFGTGFSSLGYLRQLPLHEIKIDRSFVAGLPSDTACAAIVRSILAMGKHLGLQVVAEGVETRAQADFLRANGCGVQQGWLHGRPRPSEDFLQAVAPAEMTSA